MSNYINTDNMLHVGTVLHGTYRIDRYLSSGGFGNTYVATNIQFGEQYAIKEFFMRGISQRDDNNTTVSVSNTDNRETFASQLVKFKKEARRLHKLNNEHIVQVHDLFEGNGTAYYVMDYIDGENLSERLKRTGKPLSEAEVMQLLPQILDALEAAHKEGILHLDLKPANIMVDKQGVVKLIDFGASKQQSAQGGATTSTAVSYTNGYAPREQMEQNLEKFGPWTDFYALGATLYTLLTNRKPALPSDIDDDGTKDKHLSLPLPSNVSPKNKNLILWLMSTSRTKRPQNVAEITKFLKNNGIASTQETVKDNELYEGDTVVEGAIPISIVGNDSNENCVEIDNEVSNGKKIRNIRIIPYIVGGIIIGSLILFLIIGTFNASKPIYAKMDSTAIDTTQGVSTSITVEKRHETNHNKKKKTNTSNGNETSTYGSLHDGSLIVLSGDMAGFPITIKLHRSNGSGSWSGTYKNITYGTVMKLSGTWNNGYLTLNGRADRTTYIFRLEEGYDGSLTGRCTTGNGKSLHVTLEY